MTPKNIFAINTGLKSYKRILFKQHEGKLFSKNQA